MTLIVAARTRYVSSTSFGGRGPQRLQYLLGFLPRDEGRVTAGEQRGEPVEEVLPAVPVADAQAGGQAAVLEFQDRAVAVRGAGSRPPTRARRGDGDKVT